MSVPMYILQTDAEGCDVEVSVNDIPAARLSPARGKSETKTINQLVVPGSNTISVVICPGPTPSRALEVATPPSTVPPSAAVTVRLSRCPAGSLPGDPGIVQLGQLVRKGPWGMQTTPLSAAVVIDLPATLPDWSWRRFAPLTLDEATRSAAVGLLTQLSESLSRRDSNPYLRASMPFFNDIAMAFGTTVQSLQNDFREDLADVSEAPDWQMQSPEQVEPDFRLVGQRRLIDCVAADWLPILRSMPDAEGNVVKRYPLRLAMVGGSLKIVR